MRTNRTEQFTGKRTSLQGLLAFGMMILCQTNGFAETPTTTDAWDINRGSRVLSSSQGTNGFDVRDVFGGRFGPPQEYGNFVYRDDDPKGTVHWVEWFTAAPVLLTGFNLWGTCDGPPNYWRTFDHFTLKAWKEATNSWETVYDTDISQYLTLDLHVILQKPVTAQRWWAGFRQVAESGFYQYEGPRVNELDAIGEFVPPACSCKIVGGSAELSCRNLVMAREYRVMRSFNLADWLEAYRFTPGTAAPVIWTDPIGSNRACFYRLEWNE